MKLPLKTITILVCTALIAIFAYQSYWLYNLYVTQKQEMETAVRESLRISDYNELVLRIAKLSKAKKAKHGEVSFQTGYALDKDNKLVNQGTRTKVTRNDTDAIVIQQAGWRDSLTVKRRRNGQKRMLYVNINSQRTGNAPKSSVVGNKETMFVGMVDKKQTVDDLTKMMQQGIHSGIDMVSEPDIRVFDSLLTARLTERHIDSRHRLQQLSIPAVSMSSSLNCAASSPAMTGGAFLSVRASLKQGRAKSPIALSGGVSSMAAISFSGSPAPSLSAAARSCL